MPPVVFVTGKPNKKRKHTQKKSFRDVRVSWWGFHGNFLVILVQKIGDSERMIL